MNFSDIKYFFVFGDSARGSLKYFLIHKKNTADSTIINVADIFSLGPLNAYGNPEGYQNRNTWFNDFFEKINGDEESKNYFEEAVKGIKNEIKDIKNEDKILICYGSNSSDITGLMYLASILKDKKENIYIINVSETEVEDGKGRIYRPKAFAEIHPEKFDLFFQEMKIWNETSRREYEKSWEILTKETHTLRRLEKGKIISIDDDYYDGYILDKCPKDFVMCARIIGEVMGHSEDFLSDSFVYWRIMILIEKGLIDFSGTLDSMTQFSIRKK